MAPLEARAHPRTSLMDKISVIATSSAAPLRLWSMNLSEGGICLQSAHPFRRGDRVGLRIPCGNSELAISTSEVAWVLRDVKGSSRIPAVGLRFVNLRPSERVLLKQLLERERARPQDAGLAPLPPLSQEGESTMQHEPSLPPPGAPYQSIPPMAETLPPSELHEEEPSLGPLPSSDEPNAAWAFSDAPPERSAARARGREAGNHNNFVLAAGLLVVGTVAGMIFGLMDQSGRPARKEVAQAAVVEPEAPPAVDIPAPPAAVTEPVRPAPVAVAPVRPAPVAVAPVRPAAEQRAPAPAPKPQKKAATAAVPPPTHRAGTVTLGAVTPEGKDLVLPIRGARSIERQFTLTGPDRVVVDLAADGYDGPNELRGRGSIRNVRVGRRPNGVRLVLDVSSAKTAAAARITRSQGALALVIPAR